MERGGEAGDHPGVDRIRLGQLALRSGEVAHLARIHDAHRKAPLVKCLTQRALISPRCFQADQLRAKLLQSGQERRQASGIGRKPKHTSLACDRHVPVTLRNIDSHTRPL